MCWIISSSKQTWVDTLRSWLHCFCYCDPIVNDGKAEAHCSEEREVDQLLVEGVAGVVHRRDRQAVAFAGADYFGRVRSPACWKASSWNGICETQNEKALFKNATVDSKLNIISRLMRSLVMLFDCFMQLNGIFDKSFFTTDVYVVSFSFCHHSVYIFSLIPAPNWSITSKGFQCTINQNIFMNHLERSKWK